MPLVLTYHANGGVIAGEKTKVYRSGISNGMVILGSLNSEFSSSVIDPRVTFKKWNTKPDGSGTNYSNGYYLMVNGNVVIDLYAVLEYSSDANIVYMIETDLKKLPIVHQLTGRVFSQDSEANIIAVNVKGGTLSGTIEGNIVKPDGTTLENISGSRIGNNAYLTLPEEAYDKVGKIGIFIKEVSSSVRTTLGAVEAYVYPSQTANIL